jgi:hypothetical protein
MPAKLRVVGSAETSEMRSVASKGRKVNLEYRVREHLTEAEVDNKATLEFYTSPQRYQHHQHRALHGNES